MRSVLRRLEGVSEECVEDCPRFRFLAISTATERTTSLVLAYRVNSLHHRAWYDECKEEMSDVLEYCSFVVKEAFIGYLSDTMAERVNRDT